MQGLSDVHRGGITWDLGPEAESPGLSENTAQEFHFSQGAWMIPTPSTAKPQLLGNAAVRAGMLSVEFPAAPSNTELIQRAQRQLGEAPSADAGQACSSLFVNQPPSLWGRVSRGR